MFLDEKRMGPLPEPPPAPRLTPQGERVVLALIAFNLLMMLLAPIGGATLFQGVAALFGGW
ncbi:MAG: hypothetical protein AB1592_14360 [Pseudomonadota bacterium]